jgi:hypothetical protein
MIHWKLRNSDERILPPIRQVRRDPAYSGIDKSLWDEINADALQGESEMPGL